MSARALAIPYPAVSGGELGALLDQPEGVARFAVLLAHGAGAGMETPLLDAVAGGLAASGLAVLRFRYPYMQRATVEGSHRPPDRRPELEAAHRGALDELRRRVPGVPVLLGGKSLGGRVASLLAADGLDCAGLFFLGYPLHPAGRPERLRSDHFPALRPPLLFLQGTRDPLCDLDLLEREFGKLPRPPELERIEGADHGFDLPRRTGRRASEVHADLVASILRWSSRLA